MSTAIPGLPSASRPLAFVAAMLLLHAVLALVAGVLWAMGDPGLLSAIERALGVGGPLLGIAVAVLPVAVIVDAQSVATPVGP